MGAWGIGTFENDDACDFVATIIESRSISGLEQSLNTVIEIEGGCLEALDGTEALAAADIVARLMGRSGESSSYTKAIDAWVKKVKLAPSGELVEKARLAVGRVLTEPSELVDLWRESGDFDAWKASMEALSQRLV